MKNDMTTSIPVTALVDKAIGVLDVPNHDGSPADMVVYNIPGVEGFTATNVLTSQECADCLRQADEAGFYRNGSFAGHRSRATYWDEPLAEKMVARLSPLLQKLVHSHDNEKMHEYWFVGEAESVPSGRYIPIGINPFMRVSKYHETGHFGMHRDSGYVRDDQYVGFWTVLLYLNDDFEGGDTTIYDESNRLAHTVKPEVGKVFCFHHHQVHAGLEIRSGTKHIVRTEIMFALQNP